MEFLQGVEDADKYLAAAIKRTPHRADAVLLDLVWQGMEAIQYIHGRSIAHLDIKPANLFVDETGLAVLADFGFAKHIDESGVTSGVGGTKQFMHPDYFALMTTEEDENRLLRDALEKNQIQLNWDLYSFGASVFELISIADDLTPRMYSSYVRRYLRLFAARLLDGRISHARAMGIHIPARILGLTESALVDLSYGSSREAHFDIQKVRAEIDITSFVPETDRYLEDAVQAASHSRIPFSGRIQALLEAKGNSSAHKSSPTQPDFSRLSDGIAFQA